MNRKWLLLPPLFFLLTGCILAIYTARTPSVLTNDVIALRRIASETAVHWEAIEDADYAGSPYPFSVLTLDGTVRYQTGTDAYTDRNKALASGNPILDVEKDGQVLGRVIVTSNPGRQLARYQKMTVALLLLFSLLSAFFSFLYYYCMDRRIIRPFRELKQFAAEIASGHLDFSLNREKTNMFGAFTESFDMLREQLALAREREYQANRSQKELVASLSHDIKTPVTSIRLTSELLLELEPDRRLRDKIQMIFEKTEQIEALVNNLFHDTLQDMEQLTVSPTETYSGLLEDMLKSADYAGRVQISSIPQCMILMDELRFMQVLSNILNNSYKYAGTAISVKAALTQTHLKLSIRDYGPGVPEEELPLLCSRFYRGSNAAGENGSGLGLYICKQIMEQMQGKIYCTCSQENFTVILLLKLI